MQGYARGESFPLRLVGGKDRKRDLIGALREENTLFPDMLFRERFRELTENQIWNAVRLAVVLPDHETFKHAVLGQSNQAFAEVGVIGEKRFVPQKYIRRQVGAQSVKLGKVLGGRALFP